MSLESLHHRLIITLIAFTVANCNSNTETQTAIEIERDTLSTPTLFIDFEQGGLTQPLAIEMLDENRLAILDVGLNEVLVFDDGGELDLRFGGEGRGPGEFIQPRYIDVSREYINVVDADLYRTNQFSYSGNFVQSFNFEEDPFSTTLTISEGSSYFIGSRGKNGSLLKFVDAQRDTSIFFGEALGEENQTMNLEIARQSLANGEVPDFFKNDVLLYHKDDHLYAFLMQYSRVQKYTESGELLWDTTIDLPINDMIFQNAVERAQNAGPYALPSYRYIANMKVIDEDVFLLWRSIENYPQQLVRLNEEGEIINIFHFPEEQPIFFDFAINTSTNALYLSAPGLGQVYQTEITL